MVERLRGQFVDILLYIIVKFLVRLCSAVGALLQSSVKKRSVKDGEDDEDKHFYLFQKKISLEYIITLSTIDRLTVVTGWYSNNHTICAVRCLAQ